ncbi:hypothetical protein A2763_02845 [Candidatus Kaiserbacteria bacterium RIFCSPHIGHO2_01_FULL_54_36]|uniref:Uncharacterized protein n=1 Tax=Candidatus Kaiserbacteria bacterium RIFCSPHIGHO2_01_FULL_54_36 TaxID=1798482 RepID=A0A1F6CPB5_9BACT|nr:MAG: hypothetical protein A2763_02845 [Candidatus Kaiserbacteria bacterium RIFCSPHIGHO2_01_FULL_54_36]OGG75252.1 MAG: hypothetical protein A3A41_03985 [Candidatus Kaiserbacteria bacterium RIFCSPLOWO2_01_FULL_54_22]
MRYRTYLAWSLLALALVAWAAVGLFGWIIYADEEARIEQATNAQNESLERATTVRTHAIALDTAVQSTQLNSFLDVDVGAVASMIEEVGKAAGIAVKLGNAVPENVPMTSETLPIEAIGFTVEADGTFAALMHLAQLYEKLPLPSTVTRIDLEHAPGSGTQWHMNASIRVLTTSDVSS